MKNDDINASLLKECYAMLEDIENDGWIIRGGKSTEIPKLLDRMRRVLYTPVEYAECITFHCHAKSCNTRGPIVVQHDNDGAWSYAECGGCDKRYRIIWGHDGIATIIIDCSEDK